jgi:hypothetical protein
MVHTIIVMRQYLATAVLIVTGLIASGCGDSATVNPVVELASLSVNPGTLQPAFSGGTTSYRVDLTSDRATVTVTAQPAVAGDSVTIDGQATRNRTITLEPAGETTIVNIVVSETDTNSRTYVIRLVRAGLAGNNSLQNLTVSPSTPPIAFNENTLNYTIDVASTVGSVAVTPTLQDSAATMTVNGLAATSAQARTITLNPAGQNTLITIEVTAQNDTKKSYTILVNRGGLSGINTLQSLTVSSGTGTTNLISFSSGTLGYSVNVASTVTSVTVRPTLPPNSNASMSLIVNSGQPSNINSGEARTITLGPPDSNTFINIIVTAQNGNRNTYVVAVDRAPSNDNNLSALRVNGSSVPGFTRGTLNYTVNVASNVTSVIVSATKADPIAVMSGDVTAGARTASGQATIQLGQPGSATPVSITVTPQTGNPKTYNLTIRRLSSNNNLSALTVTAGTVAQTLSPPFDAGTLPYTVNVASGVNEVTVSATKADPNAVMSVGSVTVPAGTATGQTTVPVNATPLSIAVTAPSGGAPRTYTITVRQGPPAPTLPPDLTPESDSGFLPGQDADNITNDLTPSFFIPQPGTGETPNLYVAIGSNPSGKVPTSFDAATNTLTMSNPLPSGVYDIAVTSTVTNAAGLESPQSPSLSVHIDNVPPGGP